MTGGAAAEGDWAKRTLGPLPIAAGPLASDTGVFSAPAPMLLLVPTGVESTVLDTWVAAGVDADDVGSMDLFPFGVPA